MVVLKELLVLLVVLAPLVLTGEVVEFAVASVGEQQFCVGYRTLSWSKHRFSPSSEQTYKVSPCAAGKQSLKEYSVLLENHLSATLLDPSCDSFNAKTGEHVFVKAPFSQSFAAKLNQSFYSSVMQVRGDMRSALQENDTVVLRPVEFGRIYWGAIIMYFFALVYVSTTAVLVEAGRQVVERHAATSPLEKIPFTQTRPALIIFLVLFILTMTLAFGGYVMRPLLFQPFFALFLTVVAVVGFYHTVFPLIVYIAIKHIRIVNKTYWMVERISVIAGGCVIFGLWMCYRAEQNIWPLQLLLLACIGVVPNRYAPFNCLLKCVVFTIIGVFFSALQRFIIPAVTAMPPNFVDIVTIQARIPATISPGPLFLPDDIEPSMLSFRIPLFGEAAPCSTVLDGTFGMTNFLIPSLLIKAAMITDNRLENENFLFKNYTAGVLSYLLCHIAVFVWSFVAETPVNSLFVYLPGITLGLILNSLRMGQLRKVFFPPPPGADPPQQRTVPPQDIIVYKVTAGDQV